MICKEITYMDYDGNERTEKFYFNLNKVEITNWLFSPDGCTLDKILTNIVETRNAREIMRTMEKFIALTVGQKSPDGRRFIKNDDIRDDFMQSEAYVELFNELTTDAAAAAAFVNGVMPQNMRDEMEKTTKEHPEIIPTTFRPHIPG